MMRVVHLDLDNTLIYSYKHILPDSTGCPAVCAAGAAGGTGGGICNGAGDAMGVLDRSMNRRGEDRLCLKWQSGDISHTSGVGSEKEECRRFYICQDKFDCTWMNVETYKGRNISYMTEKTQILLGHLRKKCLIVPTTTRTIEQYNRIHIGARPFEYALVCNGGILLVNGESDHAWYAQSRELAADSERELQRAYELLKKEPLRKFELRFIEKLFVFTKCNDPDTVISRLNMELDAKKVDVLSNKEKVYVVPKKLDKGMAVGRFRAYIGADEVIAAGDSRFDVPMVKAADTGVVPAGFCRKYQAEGNLKEMKGRQVFSEEMLTWIDGHIR